MMGIVYYSDIGFNTVLKRGAKAGALSQGFQGASPHFAATAWVILLWSALWFAWVFFLWIFWFVSGLTLAAGILRSEAWREKRSVVWQWFGCSKIWARQRSVFRVWGVAFPGCDSPLNLNHLAAQARCGPELQPGKLVHALNAEPALKVKAMALILWVLKCGKSKTYCGWVRLD